MMRTTFKLGSSLLLAALLLCSTVSCGPKKRPLLLKVQPNTAFTFEEHVVAATTMDLMGNTLTLKQTMTARPTLQIAAAGSDGAYPVSMTVDLTEFDFDAGGGLGSGLSDVFTAMNPLADAKDLYEGHTFTFDLTPDGHVNNVEGGEAVVDAVIAKLGLPAGTQQLNTRYALRDEIGDTGVKNSTELDFAYLTDTPVMVGDSWSRDCVLWHEFPFDVKLTYTLDARDAKTAHITVKGDVVSQKLRSDLMGLPPGMSMDVDVKGTLNGTLVVDSATGLPVTNNYAISSGGTMSVTMEGVATGSVKLPITMSFECTQTRQ